MINPIKPLLRKTFPLAAVLGIMAATGPAAAGEAKPKWGHQFVISQLKADPYALVVYAPASASGVGSAGDCPDPSFAYPWEENQDSELMTKMLLAAHMEHRPVKLQLTGDCHVSGAPFYNAVAVL